MRAGTFIRLLCISLPFSCMQNPSVIDLFILCLCLAEIKQWADWTGTVRDWWSILRLIHAEGRDEVVKYARKGYVPRCFLWKSDPKHICFGCERKSKNMFCFFPAILIMLHSLLQEPDLCVHILGATVCSYVWFNGAGNPPLCPPPP